VNGFIDHLYTRLGTTSNYGATADLHTLQITTANTKSFQPSATVTWQRLLTMEILQFPALRSSCHSCPCRILVNWQLDWLGPRLAAISHQHPSLPFAGWLSSDNWTGQSKSDSYVMTDGQSASLSWNKAPIWGLHPDFYNCQTLARLLMWSVLSDERTVLSLTFTADPRQCRHFRVRVPRYSWPYFTVSDSRLPQTWRSRSPYLYPPGTGWPGFTPRHWVPFSSPPTTRRATVEVFDPATTRDD
jgi:hypothetical protein